MQHCVFHIEEPGEKPRAVVVRTGMVFGSGPDNDCTLLDKSAAARHFSIVELQPDELTIEDVAGQESTRLQGGRILRKGERQPLKDGLVFWAGQSQITVKVLQQESGTAQREGTAPSVARSSGPRQAEDAVPAGAGEESRRAAGGTGEMTMQASRPFLPPAPPRPAPARPMTEQGPGPVDNGGSSPHSPTPAAPSSLPPSPVPAKVAPLDRGGTEPLDGAGSQVLDVLRRVRPRLVVAGAGMQRIVEIVSPDFSIGRDEEANLVINHPHVSSEHAKIRFDGVSFMLEDIASKNKTYVDGEVLASGEPRRLSGESRLTFGSIDTLFVVGEEGTSYARQEEAARILRWQGKVSPADLKEAFQQARVERRHVGEMLLRDTTLPVADWVEACRQVQPSLNAGGAVKLPTNWPLWVTILVLTLSVLLLLLTRSC